MAYRAFVAHVYCVSDALTDNHGHFAPIQAVALGTFHPLHFPQGTFMVFFVTAMRLKYTRSGCWA